MGPTPLERNECAVSRWENFLVSVIENSPLSAELEELDKALRL